ncbi:hypothetical protein GLOIN_2v1776063 [Rhizophagus irregularis DAOM 181602=DAOM 197198]|nr:hypothetical protein GLOIN_2v1776063 [Rhizophagus irregularis DAOM 181602=DAOM 197198]
MIFKPESKIKELKKSRKDIDAENIKHDIDIYEFKKLKPNYDKHNKPQTFDFKHITYKVKFGSELIIKYCEYFSHLLPDIYIFILIDNLNNQNIFLFVLYFSYFLIISNVTTGSTSVFLLTISEIKKLNSEQLNEYLRRKLKDTKNINKHVNTITVNQEVGGSNFLDLTRDDLLSIKIPLRPIKDIEKVINKIKREQSDTSDISNLKSSIEYIKDKLKDIYELIICITKKVTSI